MALSEKDQEILDKTIEIETRAERLSEYFESKGYTLRSVVALMLTHVSDAERAEAFLTQDAQKLLELYQKG